jgi:hypothetical protein
MIRPQPDDVEPCEFCIPLLAIGCLLDPDDRVGCKQRVEHWVETGTFPDSSQQVSFASPHDGAAKQGKSVKEAT